jgi:hypothetical protein
MHISAAFGWKYSQQEVETGMEFRNDLRYEYFCSVDSRAVMLVYYVYCIQKFVIHDHFYLFSSSVSVATRARLPSCNRNDASESCDFSNAE